MRAITLSGLALALALSAELGTLCVQDGGPAQATGIANAGAISGVVTEGRTGRGLGGVVVAVLNGSVKVSARTVTDSKGRFVFADLPVADGYVLEASRPGYIGDNRLRRVPFSMGTRFSLVDEQWIPDANIVLWRLGGISGSVVDEKGEPVVDVPVRVLTKILVAGTIQWAVGPYAKTDDRGAYRISGLRNGSYMVSVPSVQSTLPPSTPPGTAAGLSPATVALGGGQHPTISGVDVDGSLLIVGRYATPPPISGSLQAYPTLFHSNARSIANATPVEVAEGEEKRGIDFALQPVATLRVSGRVIGPADFVSGLVVRLLQEGAENLGNGSEQATAVVGPDGHFMLVGVPAGRYTLDASTTVSQLTFGGGPGIPPTPGLINEGNSVVILSSANFLTRRTARDEAYSARLQVTVGGTDVSNLVVVLQPGATISGRVVREDGSPLPGTISVQVDPASGDPTLGGPATSREPGQNPDGAFTIRGLHPGEYFLRLYGSVVKSISADGDYTHRPFDVGLGSDVTGVTVTVTDRTATLSGTVRDRQGVPVREAAIILFPTDRTQWTRYGLEPPRIRAVTCFGSRGYQMTRLVAGEYYAIALDTAMRDSWQDPRLFPTAALVATRVTLTWGTSSVKDLVIQRVTLQ
jgi:hypothetical protein